MEKSVTGTVVFPVGNLAPQGSVVKVTAIAAIRNGQILAGDILILAGGPLGKLRDGDTIRILVDRAAMTGTVDFIGCEGRTFSPEEGTALLEKRTPIPGLAPHPALPDDTRLWAALQAASGGTWGGCTYDTEAILRALAPSARRSVG